MASAFSLLKRVVVRVSSSSVTGVAVPQTRLEMPSFRLSPTHTGAVTARSPSFWVTRMK